MTVSLRALLASGFSLCLASLLAACPGTQEEAPTVDLETDQARMLYAIGTGLAKNLVEFDLSADELAPVISGIEDRVLGVEPKVLAGQYRAEIQAFTAERRAGERETAETLRDDLETAHARMLYAIGWGLAHSLVTLDLSADELVPVISGIEDVVLGVEPRALEVDYVRKIKAFANKRQAAMKERENKAFADEQAAVAGAERTESGLVYLEQTAGEGDSPTATDQVRVHLHWTLRDGTVVGSSLDRSEPETIALDRVIPCLSEALQKMKPGGKARLVCPPEIALGNRGLEPRIPGGAIVVIDLELFEVVQPEAQP